MKNIKKQLAVAVTVAFLAFPLSSALAQESTSDTQIVVATTTTTAPETTVLEAAAAAVSAYEAAPITTLLEVATAQGLKEVADTAVAAVVAVGDAEAKKALELRVTNRAEVIATATTALQAEAEATAAVAAYEAAPITTLLEVATAEGLKTTADTEVAAVVAEDKKAAFELRITNRAAIIETAKATLQVAAAETAVKAYEAAPITTLAEVATAEGLKAAAVTAVAAVVAEDKNAAFELRVTNQAAAIETAKTALTAPVVDADGNEVTSATWFSDLINKLQLALTYDPARKGELNKNQALRKLAQAHKLIKDGNIEASQVCLQEYTDKIAKAQAFLLEVEDPTSQTAKTLAKALVNVESNNIQVLGNLVDKLPPQAAQKLALNVVRTMEKAVDKIQKEETKVAPEVTPEVTPVVTAETEKKHLEKQVKVALAEFKKSVNEKNKIHIEDQDEDQNHENDQDKNIVKQSKPEQEKRETDRNLVTIVPVKAQTAQTAQTYRASENNKDDRNKQEDSKKDKGGDKRQDHK